MLTASCLPRSRYPWGGRGDDGADRVWLVNNDHYHTHGFSPIPSASIHAALLDVNFCARFEVALRLELVFVLALVLVLYSKLLRRFEVSLRLVLVLVLTLA